MCVRAHPRVSVHIRASACVHIYVRLICPPAYLSLGLPVRLSASSVCLSVHLSICLLSTCSPICLICLSVCPPACLSLGLTVRLPHLFVCPLAYLSAGPHVRLSASFVCLSIHLLSVSWSTCSPICLICLSVCPPAYLSTGPPVRLLSLIHISEPTRR